MIILSPGTEAIAPTEVIALIDPGPPIIHLLTHLTIPLQALLQEVPDRPQAAGQHQAGQHQVCIRQRPPRLHIHLEAERLPKICMVLMQRPLRSIW